MTKQEAKTIIEILKTADGGCEYCVKDLLEQFNNKFPEHKTQ